MGVSERRHREREERREQIIDAAEEVFFDRGLNATTMDDVAQRVELSKGALYLYFKSKDDLFTAVMNRCHEALVDELEQRALDSMTGLEQVAALARIYVRFMRDYPAHMRLLITALASARVVPEDTSDYPQLRHRELTERELRIVVQAVDRGRRDGSVRPSVEPMQLALHLWGGLTGMMTLTLHSESGCPTCPETGDVEAAFPSFVDLVLRGIAAHPQDVERLSGVA